MPVYLIHSREFNSGVVRLENLIVGEALFRQAVSADMTHADTVSPASSEKREACDTSIVVILPLDNKKLFTESQRGTNAPAQHLALPICADNFEIGRAFGSSS